MAGYNPYFNPYLQTAYQVPYPTPTVPQFPAPTYPQPTPYPQPAQAAQNQDAASGVIRWGTEADAASYTPSAGQAVAFWLRDKPVIYVKSLDTMGKPVTSILDYTERAANAPVSVPASGAKDTPYALKSDLDALRAEFAPVLALVNAPRKKEASENGEQPV